MPWTNNSSDYGERLLRTLRRPTFTISRALRRQTSDWNALPSTIGCPPASRRSLPKCSSRKPRVFWSALTSGSLSTRPIRTPIQPDPSLSGWASASTRSRTDYSIEGTSMNTLIKHRLNNVLPPLMTAGLVTLAVLAATSSSAGIQGSGYNSLSVIGTVTDTGNGSSKTLVVSGIPYSTSRAAFQIDGHAG